MLLNVSHTTSGILHHFNRMPTFFLWYPSIIMNYKKISPNIVIQKRPNINKLLLIRSVHGTQITQLDDYIIKKKWEWMDKMHAIWTQIRLFVSPTHESGTLDACSNGRARPGVIQVGEPPFRILNIFWKAIGYSCNVLWSFSFSWQTYASYTENASVQSQNYC